MISLGLDVNKIGPSHVSPLYLAAESRQVKILEELIHAGAQVNFINDKGYSALHIAAELSVLSSVKDLLQQ